MRTSSAIDWAFIFSMTRARWISMVRGLTPRSCAMALFCLPWVMRSSTSRPVRESGFVAFVIAALAAIALTWTLSGIWDTQQRTAALIALGYSSPTFDASTSLAGDDLAPIAFQAVRDGERVRGVIKSLGGDRWQISEINESDD